MTTIYEYPVKTPGRNRVNSMSFTARKHKEKDKGRKIVFPISSGGFVTPVKNLMVNSIFRAYL